MNISPCNSATNLLRLGIGYSECDCCGRWELKRLTDPFGILRSYAVNSFREIRL